MAGAPAAPTVVNVRIDGKDYQFPKGTNLLMACLKAENPQADYPDQNTGGEHYVPHFCYHPGLSVSGNCRMCFVKTRQMVKRGDQLVPMEQMATSCTNTVAEGLEVFTKSDDVRKVRAGIMDLELINHPLDCPECDKAGECALQDFAFDHGHAASKFDFEKVQAHIKPLSEKITIWGTRCIQCSRCIRVADEISGTNELCFVGRGDHTVIDIFPGKPIENELSLNTVEVCPVGALKNRDFLYTARVWNLDEMPGVCGLCAKGCAVRVDSLKGDVTRVMARENPKVNDFWICDQARLDYQWINSPRRIDRPRTNRGEIAWDRALDAAAEALRKAAAAPAKAWAVGHASMTNEEMWLFRKLLDRVGITNIAVMAEADNAPLNFPKFKSPADANANRAGAKLILGVDSAEQSIKAFADACARGAAEHVVVWAGLPHGMDKQPEVTRALAHEKVTNILAVDFQTSVLTELAHVSLASTTYVETAGSWINHEGLLQAFRAALPYPRQGRIGTEIIQELLFRLGDTVAEAARGMGTPIATGSDDPYRHEAVQRGWEGSSTVPVFAGRGEVAVETRPRKLILSPAAVFDQMSAAMPQFAGHSHLSLIRAKGAKLA